MTKPTPLELRDLWEWMYDEWASNYDYELPPEVYGEAVLAKFAPSYSIPKDNE